MIPLKENVQNGQIRRDRKCVSDCHGGLGMTACGHSISLGGESAEWAACGAQVGLSQWGGGQALLRGHSGHWDRQAASRPWLCLP